MQPQTVSLKLNHIYDKTSLRIKRYNEWLTIVIFKRLLHCIDSTTIKVFCIKNLFIWLKAGMKSYIPLETIAIFFLANLYIKHDINSEYVMVNFNWHWLAWPLRRANRKLQIEKFSPTVGFEPGTFRLCLAHIKIYDRAIKIWSVGRPIYHVWLSQIGRWREFTLKIWTADHSWELFCFASVDHRPFIARQSDDSRAIIGQPVTDKYIFVHAYYITM